MPRKTYDYVLNLWDLERYYNFKISDLEGKEKLEPIEEATLINYKLKLDYLNGIRSDFRELNKYNSPTQKYYLKTSGELEEAILNGLINELDKLGKND